MQIDQTLIDELNKLLALYPGSITRLTSTPAHNAAIGGAPLGAHPQGKAADLTFDSMAILYAATRMALTLNFTGVELDLTNNHLHVDTLGRKWKVVHHGPGKEEALEPWLERTREA